MIDIDNLQEYYSAYIEGELLPQHLKEFEAALEKNTEARQTIERMRIIREQMQQMPVLSVSPDFENRLQQRIQHLNTRPFLHIPFPDLSNWKTTAVAAAVVVVVTVSSLMWFSPGEGESPGGVSPTTSSSMAPIGTPGKPTPGAGNARTQPAEPNSTLEVNSASEFVNTKDDSTDREQLRNLRNNIQVVKDKAK